MSTFNVSEASELEHEGRTIGYVIRSGRCRSIRILVSSPEDVEVRIPQQMSSRAARAFVSQHADWILRAMEKLAKRRRLAPRSYVTGATVYYLGRPCRLEVTRSVWKKVVREDGVLRVALYHDEDAGRVKALVEEWFFERAREVLAAVLADMLERFGGRIRHARCPLVMRSDGQRKGLRLTVREMKTQWGSCTKDGHITLGVELIHVPRPLIEYVIVHELCHLARLDHSKAFYAQLAMCLPDWKERRDALKNHAWLQKQVQP